MGYNDYYIYGIILDGCPYSMMADELIRNNTSRFEILNVNHDNKNEYKNDNIQTFPQIYLKKYNSNFSELIGGYTEFKQIYDIVKNAKNTKTTRNKVIKLLNKGMKEKSKKAMIIMHIILDVEE